MPFVLKYFLLVFSVIVIVAFSTSTVLAQPFVADKNVGNATEEYVPGELIITLKQRSQVPTAREISSFHTKMMTIVPHYNEISKWESATINVSVIKVDEGDEKIYMKFLKKNPNIASVELNRVVKSREHVTSSDPDFSLQSWNYDAVNVVESWHYSTGTSSTMVAVVDTGIDWNNEDLNTGIWSNDDSCTGGTDNDSNGKIDDCRGWDFVNNDNNPIDDESHGTFVSGIIGARLNNGIRGVGVAPQITLMPVKVLDSSGSGSESDVIAGMEYAISNGAKVINLSLGSYGTCSSAMQNVLNSAYSDNVLVIHAAGQSGTINMTDSIASCDHVISVTATDNLNKDTSYTDQVSSIDLAAPGGDVPNTANPGALLVYSNLLNNDFGGGIGTSFATPHVSGCTALILSVNPSLTFDQVENKLETSALDLTESAYTPNNASVGKDSVFGYGLLQCDVAVTRSLPSGMITGVKYDDINANGMQDIGETGISGVTMTIYNYASNTYQTATTASDGSFQFDDVAAGIFFLYETNIPTGYRVTEPVYGYYYQDIAANQTLTLNFGNSISVTLSRVLSDSSATTDSISTVLTAARTLTDSFTITDSNAE